MIKPRHIFWTLIVGSILICSPAWAQNPHGNPLARAKNVHSGNKIRTTFYNYGLVGRMFDAVDDIGGEWPLGSTHEYIGDVSILVGAEIQPLGMTRPSVVTSFGPRAGNEMSGDIFWGWEPLAGYANDDTNLVAMSHLGPSDKVSQGEAVNTWPDFWPDKSGDANDPGWPGAWNGYFGKDQKNADQESFFVMDDANDAEFLWYPDTLDEARRGLGLKATVRGMQWNHILAEDVLFWVYDIHNIGHKSYSKMVFGTIVGTITGGDGDTQDDYADFDKVDDIAFSFDHGTDLETGLGGVGAGGWTPVGVAGYAFLESPGNAVDGIDNDGDGADGSGDEITPVMFLPVQYFPGNTVVVIDYSDYSRSTVSMPSDSLVIPYNENNRLVVYPGRSLEEIPRNLIDDNLNGLIDENNGASIEIAPGFFEEVYLNVGLKYIDYLTGIGLDNPMIDESREDGIDNDGDWNPLTDDVGQDGAAGSGDTFFGEGDGLPTSGAGTNFPGEPHIDKTDIDESDQIGLSSFYFFKYGTGPQMNDDPRLWNNLDPGFFNKSVQNADADFIFGSGYFPLLPDKIERFSLALLFGDNLPDLIRNKQTVQTIYNLNYNFAKAPDLPTLQAYAGDGYVTLYWDDRAEYSYDNLTGYDFEGYKIYKATDTRFSDAGFVTDAFGSEKFNVPIKQFDLVNEYSGFFETGVDGAQFNLGDNTGLAHTWTDTNVINGHRYFYAVTAYDHGDETMDILPAETAKFVTIDKGGSVQAAINVAAVIPDAPVAGFIAPDDGDDIIQPVDKARGTGSITLNYLDYQQVKDGHTYRIYFMDTYDNQIDDDADWIPYWDIPNGIYDSTEAYLDYGLDGLLDEQETGPFYYPDGSSGYGGYDPLLNPDPAHDNYAPSSNCRDGMDNDGDGEIDEVTGTGACDDLGTQYNGRIDWIDANGDGIYQASEDGETFTDFGNGIRDAGENLRDDVGADGLPNTGDAGEGDGIPTWGEPNFDYLDIDEAVPRTTHFMVVDETDSGNPDTVAAWSPNIDGDLAIFDGLQILLRNHWEVTQNKNASGFAPSHDEEYNIIAAPFNFSGIATKGVSYPRDLQIIFSDDLDYVSEGVELLRTNGNTLTLPSLPTNFTIFDPYDNSPVPFGFIDQSYRYIVKDSVGNVILDSIYVESGYFSKWDRIILLQEVGDTTIVTWSVSAMGEDSSSTMHYPMAGDTLHMAFLKTLAYGLVEGSESPNSTFSPILRSVPDISRPMLSRCTTIMNMAPIRV